MSGNRKQGLLVIALSERIVTASLVFERRRGSLDRQIALSSWRRASQIIQSINLLRQFVETVREAWRGVEKIEPGECQNGTNYNSGG